MPWCGIGAHASAPVLMSGTTRALWNGAHLALLQSCRGPSTAGAAHVATTLLQGEAGLCHAVHTLGICSMEGPVDTMRCVPATCLTTHEAYNTPWQQAVAS